MENSLEGVLAESVPWSDKTFPDATVQSIKTHLLREWKELVESGFDDPSEYADVVLLMAHLASRKGFFLEQAVRNKFEVNKARKWGEVDEDGVVEHVREEEWRGPGHVEHWNGEGEHPSKSSTVPVHFMKIGPNGEPFAIGSTKENAYLGMTTYAPPVYPTYRASIVEGQVVFEKMVYQNHSGGEHRWVEVEKNTDNYADITMRNKIISLLDIGVQAPIQLSVYLNGMGEFNSPILNERWETVFEIDKGTRTGRVGKVRFYRQGGKEFASPPVWGAVVVNE